MPTSLHIWTKAAKQRIRARFSDEWRNLFGLPVQDAIAAEAAYDLLLTQLGTAQDMDTVRRAIDNARALYGALTGAP